MKTVIYKYERNTTNYKNYKTEETNEQIKQDIKGNGAYLVKIFTENQIKEIKSYGSYERTTSKLNPELIDYIQDCI